jgi:phenylpropionate dioxygenase-like ring-hydroxylating dioxygenase large terminal subunit
MWIPIALSRDIPSGVTRAVVLEGRELVIWRSQGGAVQVWEDRCPHRGMRLSFGFVRGEALNCLYHGWQYGTAGSCQKIPAHSDLVVPNTIRANAYPVVERGNLIWTRPSPETAAPDLPESLPLASVAVDADADTILALCAAAPQGGAQIFAADLDGMALQIGWHESRTRHTMLHASLRGSTDLPRGLAALHRLRADAERKAAA